MGKNIKLPLEAGFATLCNHIKAIRATAEQSGSAVAALAESTAASLEEIDGLFDTKQDKTSALSVTIPVNGWQKDESTVYPYTLDLSVNGITAKDRAEITLAPGSLETALGCGLCPVNESMPGMIRIRSTAVPGKDMAAEIWIEKGKEQ